MLENIRRRKLKFSTKYLDDVSKFAILTSEIFTWKDFLLCISDQYYKFTDSFRMC